MHMIKKTKGEFFLIVAESGIHPSNITSNCIKDNIFSYSVTCRDKVKLRILRENLNLSEFTHNIDKFDCYYAMMITCEDTPNHLSDEDIKKIDKAIAFSC